MPESDPAFTAPATLVVLDTNVVLDLWLFGDARSAPLRQALAAGRLTPLATAPMLAELADVLQRPFTAGWPVPPAQALVALQTCARLVDPPAPAAPPAPRCTDPDDQKFIDLAAANRAILLSKDKAVICMRKRLANLGADVATEVVLGVDVVYA